MILANFQSRHVQAIQLLLEGELKDKEIAQQLGVRPDTLAKWKASPVFQQRYQLERGIWEEDLRDIRLAVRSGDFRRPRRTTTGWKRSRHNLKTRLRVLP